MSIPSPVGDVKVLSSISTFVKTKHANSKKMPFFLFFISLILLDVLVWSSYKFKYMNTRDGKQWSKMTCTYMQTEWKVTFLTQKINHSMQKTPCSYLRQYLKVNMIKITLNDSAFCDVRINILIKGENHNCKLIRFILASSLVIKTRACTSRRS